MKQKRAKHVHIVPKDFSNQKYFPGTPSNPYHSIQAIQEIFAKIPIPIWAIIFGIVTYFVLDDIPKSLLMIGFVSLDWLLLRLLPIFRISFGPPDLTTLVLGFLRLPFQLFNLPIAVAFQVFGTLLVLYGFYIEPNFPKTTHHKITLSKGDVENGELCIVHLSDLHMEFFTHREEKAINIINALTPDIILYSGDFFNLSYQDNQESHRDIIRFFNRLDSKHGTYAVSGSPSVDLPERLKSIEPELNLKLLKDQVVDLKINDIPLQIIGLTCSHQPAKDYKRLEKVLIESHDNKPKTRILLYHSPDIAPHLQSLSIDLQLSGHTHGGQVQIPFCGPLYSGSLYGLTFSSGHYLVNNALNLIISRGLGLEGDAAPRVRFFSPPEICFITLELTCHHVKLG